MLRGDLLLVIVCVEPPLLRTGDDLLSGAVEMRLFIAIAISAIALASCTPEGDVTGSVGACTAKLYSPYNPKDMKQCVNACLACDRGVVTTCTTSCTLKGAH